MDIQNISHGNDGVNCHYFNIGTTCYYFSYQTLIAVRHKGVLVIRQNVWSTTTGKHLNQINPDHSIKD